MLKRLLCGFIHTPSLPYRAETPIVVPDYTWWFRRRGYCLERWLSVIVKKKKFIWTCIFSEWLPGQSCLNLPIKSIVNGNKKRESTVSCILILIWCLNKNIVIVNNKCLEIPPSSSVPLQLVCEDHVFFVWVDLHVSLCEPAKTSRVSTFLL